MKLYYSISKAGNFGDDMNTWFWDALLKGWREAEPDVTLFGIGTILGNKILQSQNRALICGSGAGYGAVSTIDRSKIDISWVRGPRTAALIGLDRGIAITDPACMTTTMPEFLNLPKHTAGIIFIPHRSTAQLDLNWDRIGDQAGMRVVLPSGNAREIIAEIARADLVVTESMHGAIFADAFRVPWVAVRISNEFNDFKWRDWAESMDVEIQFQEAFRLPKKAWFMMKALKHKIASPRSLPHGPRLAQPAFGQPVSSLPADLGEEDRQRVKKLARTFAPVLETALARDLKKARLSHPQLSPEDVVADKISQIQHRLAKVQDRIDRSLDLP